MSYLAVWKVLEGMVTDFREKGIIVPVDVMSDLRYAKTLINVLKADPSHVETSQRVEEYLRNVESYLISEGQKKLGSGYVDEWLRRLDEASKKVFEGEEEAKFIPGLPREQKWIRVRPSGNLSVKRLKALAGELNLSYDVQSDGCLLVFGEEERIKDFVKKMATKYGLKAAK
jgi:hypothetical protein